jgi:hypothetical protein
LKEISHCERWVETADTAHRREYAHAQPKPGGRNVIVVKKGQTWRCSSKECGAEILVMHESKAITAEALRCWCGAEMRKPYEKPQVHATRA